MFKKYLIIFGIITILLVSLSLLAKPVESKKSIQKSEEIKLSEFKGLNQVEEIELTGNYNIKIEQSNIPDLKITGKNKNNLNVYVENKRLYVKKNEEKSKFSFGKNSDIEIKISLPKISYITVNGAVDMESNNGIKGDNLIIALNGVGSIIFSKLDYNFIKASVNGAGEMELSGNTNSLSLTLNGVGSIDTQNLKAYTCRADNSGIGSISLYAENELDAKIGGLGSIEYLGNPRVKKNIDGLGSISRIE